MGFGLERTGGSRLLEVVRRFLAALAIVVKLEADFLNLPEGRSFQPAQPPKCGRKLPDRRRPVE